MVTADYPEATAVAVLEIHSGVQCRLEDDVAGVVPRPSPAFGAFRNRVRKMGRVLNEIVHGKRVRKMGHIFYEIIRRRIVEINNLVWDGKRGIRGGLTE